MDHTYEFFDRSAFDPLWTLSWKAFEKKYPIRWVRSLDYRPGEYTSRSLRELIAFVTDQTSLAAIEDVIARRTVRWTIRHSTPQFFTMTTVMSELADRVSHLRTKYLFVDTTDYIEPLIAAALEAHARREVSDRALFAVLKLHGFVGTNEVVPLSRTEKAKVTSLMRKWFPLEPIYTWQGYEWFKGEEWAGCLGVADTRRFIKFIIRAWEENWRIPNVAEDGKLRFRDFEVTNQLAKPLQKHIQQLKQPCVYRCWS